MIGALFNNPDAALDAIAIAAGKPRAWLDALDTDELVRLGTICLEINADFFVHRLAPEIRAASARLMMAMAGLTSFSASLQTATGTPT
jgi:ABC-type cobalamin transport system ATPase subunit